MEDWRGCFRTFKASFLAVSALLAVSLLLTVTATSAASASITVTPSSGAAGTTFQVSFLAPLAEPALAYHALLKATGGSHKNTCVSHLEFRVPPQAASANELLKFAFTPKPSSELCTGAWSITVKASGKTVLTGGRFKIT